MFEVLQRGRCGGDRLSATADCQRLAHCVAADTDRLALCADVGERVGQRIGLDADAGADNTVCAGEAGDQLGNEPPLEQRLDALCRDRLNTFDHQVVHRQIGTKTEVGQ